MKNAHIFAIKDCALITIATGRKANNLAELRENLQGVGGDSIYHHFLGGLLTPRFEEREFHNDFSGWARHSLREPELAERLAVINPAEGQDMEAIRQRRSSMSSMTVWTKVECHAGCRRPDNSSFCGAS